MFDFVKDIFRKRSLRRHASTVPTGILPLTKIKSYVAIIDVEDPSFDTCKTTIMNYFRGMDINGAVFFQDFRKIGNEDRLITSIQTTITKKDLDWLGRPSKYKMGVLEERAPDVFISLNKERAKATGWRPFRSGCLRPGRKRPVAIGQLQRDESISRKDPVV